MSTTCMSAVFKHSKSTGLQRLILLAMADEANDQGLLTAYRRSQPWLAKKANAHESSVTRAIKQLIALGEVIMLAHGNGRKSADYRIILPDLEPLDEGKPDADPGSARGDPRASESRTQGKREAAPIIPFSPDDSRSAPKAFVASDEAERLCDLLATLIAANGSKCPEVTEAWLREADRMLRLDGRDPEKAERLLRWCQADPFWQGNILSMRKFREKYDQLRLKANAERNGNGTKNNGRPRRDGSEWDRSAPSGVVTDL